MVAKPKTDDSTTLTDALLGNAKSNVDSTLDGLFKASAGPVQAPSAHAAASTTPSMSLQDIQKLSKRKQKKAFAEKAEEAARRARALSSLPPLKRKRKAAEAVEQEVAETKESDSMPLDQPESSSGSQDKAEVEKEKNDRTIFVGNVPVACCTEKSKLKELKRKFAQYGKIESLRFRSMAFSETLPRKAAFITQKFHSSRNVTNTYIVYKSKESVTKALEMNGHVFMDKHLRVDSVANPKSHDRKRSVFVGSLPYDVEEEELWVFFKDCGLIESVRVVRDKKTNIGKGIGYVQFIRRASVDLALALEDKTFRETHKLRIQRCKDKAAEGIKSASKEIGKKKHGKSKPAPASKSNFKKGHSKKPFSVFEGARASKSTGNKFKIGKTSGKTGKPSGKPSGNRPHKKQKRS